MNRNRVARTSVVASLLVLVACLLPAGSGPAFAARPSPAAPAATDAPIAGTQDGQAVEVAVRLRPEAPEVEVTITPRQAVPGATLRLTTSSGDRELSRAESALGDLRPGETLTRSVALSTPPAGGEVGIVAGVVAAEHYLGSRFLAVRAHQGGLVSAPAFGLLDDAALAADRAAGRLTEQSYRQRLAEVHKAPGSAGAVRAVTSPSPSAVATTRITGTITYRDRNNVSHPVRGATVEFVDIMNAIYGSARTTSTGTFSITATITVTKTYWVRVSSDVANGWVANNINPRYTAFSASKNVAPGSTWSGVTINLTRDSLEGRAFALLDALYTVSNYYVSIRQPSWQAKLGVIYPSGDNLSYADSNGLIFIRGGDTQCGGTWCSEDAFDWDVLGHESGHIVGRAAGMINSPGGPHDVCAHAWSGGRSKTDAVGLAWSEGWATFYGLVALSSGVPSGMPNAGGTDYDDPTGPPHNAGINLSYSLESNSSLCSPGGDDSEVSVSRALWDFWDSANDSETVSWSLTNMLGRLDPANATTFSAAWQALSSGRTMTELDSAGTILETMAFSPTSVMPMSGTVGNSPVHFAWAPGGPPAHLNNSFTVTVRRASNLAVLASVFTGANTDYLPDTATWATIAAAGTVTVEVSGGQTTAPASSGYLSHRNVLTIGGVPRFMVVGDSISHGLEGDYTWRYRLKQHMETSGVTVDFVGPYRGTNRIPAALPDDPNTSPPLSFSAAYRDNLLFDSDHFAQWGRQTHQAMNDVRSRVSQFQPDYLLVELGFNDLGWFVSNDDAAIADMKTLIAEARAARPDIRILVANVVHRTFLPVNPNLGPLITSYNTKLGPALQTVNTANSPVRLVDIDTGYDPNVDAYDGLHPAGSGEYKIARAFANVLSSQFGLGGTFGPIPSVSSLPITAATGLDAVATDAGITVSWNHVFGASGYWFYQRDVTNGEVFGSPLPLPIGADSWKVGWVLRGHTYEFQVQTNRGNQNAGLSNVDSVVADPKTADGPPNIRVIPGSGYLDVSWDPAVGPYSGTVTGYAVHYNDSSVPGSILTTVETSTRSIRLSGLVNGHLYQVAVSSRNAAGVGTPNGGPWAYPGMIPVAPTLQSAIVRSPIDVELVWTAVPGATAYWILQRNATAGDAFVRLPLPVTGTTFTSGWLFSGAINYEFCIIAANGSLESPPSNCRRATNP